MIAGRSPAREARLRPLAGLWQAGVLQAENDSEGTQSRDVSLTERKVSLRQPPLHRLVAAVSAPAETLSGDDGQIRAEGAQGFYVEDVRVLSQLVLTVNGEEPVPLERDLEGGSSNRFEAAVFNVENETVDPVLFVTRHRRLSPTTLTEEVVISSCARRELDCWLVLHLASDLAPMLEVKSGLASQPGPSEAGASGLLWRSVQGSVIEAFAAPAPGLVDPSAGCLGWQLAVAPGDERRVVLTVRHVGGGGVHGPAPVRVQHSEGGGSTSGPETISVSCDDQRLVRFVDRSLADLSGLRMSTRWAPDDAVLAAGVPWYLTLFGRDSIWSARLLLPLGVDLARGTLRSFAARQGRVVEPLTCEEPGKMFHEVRRVPDGYERFPGGLHVGSMAPLPPIYYGTVDATLLWVCLLHDAWRWGLPDDDVAPLLDPMERCLGWLSDYGRGSGPFVTYVNSSGRGLANQGWKDSGDGIQFRDGTIATGSLALCEAQGYAYEAALAGAELLEAFARQGADRWRQYAFELKRSFRECFWVDDDQGAYPAVALDGQGRLVDSLTSNIGHLLGTGLLDAEEASLVARRLADQDLSGGYGLRTLAASSQGFNPLGYHNGSVWPHDTAIAIAGLARTPGEEARRAARTLIEGLLVAAEHFEYRMPELYGGHDRSWSQGPIPYPAACRPQAWSAASAIAVLVALAGVRPDVPGGTLSVEALEGFGPLRVDGLRVSDAILKVRCANSGPPEVSGVPASLRVQL